MVEKCAKDYQKDTKPCWRVITNLHMMFELKIKTHDPFNIHNSMPRTKRLTKRK